jgi:hypothetical protein
MTVDTMEDLYQAMSETTTDEKTIREAASSPTVRTGSYRFEITSKKLARGDDTFRDGTPNPNAGRIMVRLGGSVFLDGERKGSVFFNASPEERRKTTGKLDGATKLWAQLVKALDLKGKPNNEVFESLESIPYSVYTEEVARTPEGLKTIKDDETRQGYQQAGYEFQNFVYSIRAIAG